MTPPGTDVAVAWAVRGLLVLLAVIVVGAVVGGVIYGPRLQRALVAAETGKVTTTVAAQETEYERGVADAQARTQAAEVAVTLQMQESTRDTLASPDAGQLVSPDLYGRFADGVRRNRSVQSGAPPGGGDRPGADAAAGTADPEP
jgi:hypothetical protein